MPELVIPVPCFPLDYHEMAEAYDPCLFVQTPDIETFVIVNYGFWQQVRMRVDLEVNPTQRVKPCNNYWNTRFAQIAAHHLINLPKPATQRFDSIIRSATEESR